MTTRPKYLTGEPDVESEADYVLRMFDALRDELGQQFYALTRDERRAWLKDWQARHPPPGEKRPAERVARVQVSDWEERTPNR
jgi:hypothetical protein